MLEGLLAGICLEDKIQVGKNENLYFNTNQFPDFLDFPDLALLAPKRGFSVSALQSLALYNNDFVLHAAGWLANRVENEVPESQRVSRVVQLCWQRDPTEAERTAFEAHARTHGLPALCRVLLNSNEFLFVD